MSGLDLLKRIRADYPDILVIMLTAFGTIATAVEAMNDGAHDYITKPVHSDELELVAPISAAPTTYLKRTARCGAVWMRNMDLRTSLRIPNHCSSFWIWRRELRKLRSGINRLPYITAVRMIFLCYGASTMSAIQIKPRTAAPAMTSSFSVRTVEAQNEYSRGAYSAAEPTRGVLFFSVFSSVNMSAPYDVIVGAIRSPRMIHVLMAT
jgi:CheY-like chemotaxis protein